MPVQPNVDFGEVSQNLVDYVFVSETVHTVFGASYFFILVTAGSWDGSEWEVLMDEVKQRIAELSVESGYHMSKKAKKAQKATFREFMSTIVDDEPPCEVITFRGGTLTLQSWREVIQLNFGRHCLQGGFQIQLLTNPTLHVVFSANGQLLNDLGAAAMTQLEKRLTLSKTSEAAKAADRELTRNRRVRTNIKNDFLTKDGDDI